VVDQLPGARVHASGIEFLEYRLAFGSDVSCVERNVAWLISGSAGLLSEAQRVQVQATLIELILNAIEHGSLEISYQEKKEALEQDRYDALLTARRRDPRLAARLVTVRVLYEKRGRFLRYTVSDEGKGFQWKTLLEHWPGPPSIHHANGRGVYLAQTFFPELSYNDDGNEATFTVPLP
jgi:Histidine kinase-like ATPase domain